MQSSRSACPPEARRPESARGHADTDRCAAMVAARRGLLALLFACPGVCTANQEQACEEALSRAEVAVARARSREALWTTAAGALRDARRLRHTQQWRDCIETAEEAHRLAELGILQLDYPPERDWFSPGTTTNGGTSQ